MEHSGLTSIKLALQYDHVPPQHSSDAVLEISVANYTRNVFIGTESNQYLGDGNTVPVEERGHIMFMHNDDVRVKNLEVFEMGRTDKSMLTAQAIDRLKAELDAGDIRDNRIAEVEAFLANQEQQSDHFASESEFNVEGRYAIHFHRTGVNDLENPALLEGSTVWGSPGWGIVHHDANLDVVSNAVFGVTGGGIVAEAGSETGVWSDNIVIQTTGKVVTFNAESSGVPHSIRIIFQTH